ncbi:MAG TPA: hypothetical protein VFK66_01355 [Oryzihumus sp.]|nr:hypothetical protein [Oryzihumus sp.]
MAHADRHAMPLLARVAAAIRRRDEAELSALRPVIWALATGAVRREELAGLTLAQALDRVLERQPRRRWADRR